MGSMAGPVYFDLTNERYWYKRADGTLAGPFESRMEAETMQAEEETPVGGLELPKRRHADE